MSVFSDLEWKTNSPINATQRMFLGEVRQGDFDFSAEPTILTGGQTIASVTSILVDVTGLTLSIDAAQASLLPANLPTIGNGGIASNKVYFFISSITGGGAAFNLTCTAVSSGGEKLILKGRLVVN